jgi:hypothetical protein
VLVSGAITDLGLALHIICSAADSRWGELSGNRAAGCESGFTEENLQIKFQIKSSGLPEIVREIVQEPFSKEY